MTMNTDINTGMKIRPTDNLPKEEDDYQLADQYPKPMTEEQIKAKIDELLNTTAK